MTKYTPTIGLEVHVELKTATKMFCDCPNDPKEKHPNVNVCPICLGHPGALPTINKRAVEHLIAVGFAVNGKINEQFKFDRKNYFYPDLPKGYQISQFDLPIVKGGEVKGIRLNRVHLEEDAGKLVHGASFAEKRGQDAETRGKSQRNSAFSLRESATLVDFNRGGVPLMELVTEPEMHSVKEAAAFAKELQLILRYLGVSDADLERGQMRFDANVSLSETRGNDADSNAETRGEIQRNSASGLRESATLGTKVEIKNLNSFRALEEALNYEIQRQQSLLDSGEKVKQETRGWDDVKKKTMSQRSKEEAHDYRYFPEPDLPPLESSAFDLKGLRLSVPELPEAKRRRFKQEFQLTDAEVNILVEDRKEAEFFEAAVSEWEADKGGGDIKLLFNYLTSDLRGLMRERGDFPPKADQPWAGKITPENFADLMDMISKNEISSRVAKDLLIKMLASGVDPRTLVENEGLSQVSDEIELMKTVMKVIAENPNAVSDYKKGKSNALQFLIGKAMAELKGRGNPLSLKSLFDKELK